MIKKCLRKYYVRYIKKGRWDSRDSYFGKLVCLDAGIECLASSFIFTEGPVWLADQGYLLFSDIPASKIYRYIPGVGISVFRSPSGKSNGLTRDRDGMLLACEHENRRVSRTDANGQVKSLAASFKNKKLNSPNDIVVKKDGAIYFTDPPYGIKEKEQEQEKQGVYRIAPGGKELQMVAEDFDRPNGLAFSPDETKLYIDDSSRKHIRVFRVDSDGSLKDGKIFVDMNIPDRGNPDGMKVDVNGNIYCTGPGGIWVVTPESKVLGIIRTHEQPANCAWGDPDYCSLYITARTALYKIRVNIPGLPVL
ncbi:MAG: SMP-30/gluconolactonase/LRE family protein [Candidatus Brocadiae bacterium]|nr:SMP-30/gluconolactonase/LRE family protein [Candidatus Brocadiia bacterium]